MSAGAFLSGLKSQKLDRRMFCVHVSSLLLGMGHVMPGVDTKKSCNQGVIYIKGQQAEHRRDRRDRGDSHSVGP